MINLIYHQVKLTLHTMKYTLFILPSKTINWISHLSLDVIPPIETQKEQQYLAYLKSIF